MPDEAAGRSGGTASDGPDDRLGGEPVLELRFKLVLKLSDVLAAEDTGESTRPGADLGREAARELQMVQGRERRE